MQSKWIAWHVVLLLMAAAWCGPRCQAVAAPPRKPPAKPPAAPRVLEGIEALQFLCGNGRYAEAEQYAYRLLWEDAQQPEVLDLLVRALEAQKKKDEASVLNAWLLRLVPEKGARRELAALRAGAMKRRAILDREFEGLKAKYLKAAAGKQFHSPAQVADLWMTAVTGDLAPLHGLYAWKLIGGRKDLKPEWIHNQQGTLHRSGMKYLDEVDGRKGVLFAVPLKADHPRAVKQGHLPQITIKNAGKCRFLRVGTKAYNFPYTLKIRAGQRELFSQSISPKAWSDLKIDLGPAAGTEAEVILELAIPPEQGPYEGAWFDYVDFFEN